MPRFINPPITESAEQFDRLADSAMVDQATVQAIFQCSSNSVWRWCKDGTLPEPRRFGRAVRWNVGELRAVLARKAA